MANPSVIARTTPTGYKLPEGFKCSIAYSLRPAFNIFEVSTMPAGGQAVEIDTSTQHNIKYKTKWISALVEIKDVTGEGGYDPDFMDDAFFLLGAQSGSFTVHAPTQATHNYWGGLKDLTFQAWKAGQFPMVSYANCCTCWDPTTKTEAGPYTVQATGT